MSARKVDGKRVLRITTAMKYFSRYGLCVTAPDGALNCVRGRMRDPNDDGFWTGSMNWRKRFPDAGPGAYTVRWEAQGPDGDFRSPRVGFHE